jgi:hypothetical protein
MSDLAARVTAALDGAEAGSLVPLARRALAAYIANPSRDRKDSLLTWLESVVGEAQAMDLLGIKPPRKGLVYCCSTIGWVTPARRFDHRWDAYSGMN